MFLGPFIFLFRDTLSPYIYPLSPRRSSDLLFLACAALACKLAVQSYPLLVEWPGLAQPPDVRATLDRKSTRLNSSHTVISYAVFCLKKKTNYDYNGHDHTSSVQLSDRVHKT